MLYYSKLGGKLESRVMEATFVLYAKSDREYYVIVIGGAVPLHGMGIEQLKRHAMHQALIF